MRSLLPTRLSLSRFVHQDERQRFQNLSFLDRVRALYRRRRRLVDYWVNPSFEPEEYLRGHGITAWVEPLDTIIADGAQISNSAVETIVCPDFSIPAFYMFPGRTLRIWSFGVMSNVVTTPGTYVHSVRWGGVSGTVLCKTAAQGLDTTAHTNALWCHVSYHVLRTSGTTGTMMSGGFFECFNLLASTAANLLPAIMGSAGTPGASGNVAVTVDSTTAKLLSVTGTFSVATNPTNLTCQQRIVEALN